MPETCTSTTAQEHSFLWDDGEIATTIGRERRISPTCVHIKISGRKRVFYFYSSCPMVCCGVVSTLFLSLSYQLTSSSSSLQGIARASSVSALASFVNCSQDRTVTASELSVDFVFFFLARHIPSKLGLCSCFVRQLFSGYN